MTITGVWPRWLRNQLEKLTHLTCKSPETRYEGARVAEWCPAARNRENVLAGDGITFHWPSADIDLMPRLRWRLVRRSGKNTVVLEAGSTPETMKAWPHPFRLQATITETNTGKKPYESSFMAEPRFADEAGCGVKVDGRQPTGKMPKAQPLAPGKSRKHGIRLSVVK